MTEKSQKPGLPRKKASLVGEGDCNCGGDSVPSPREDKPVPELQSSDGVVREASDEHSILVIRVPHKNENELLFGTVSPESRGEWEEIFKSEKEKAQGALRGSAPDRFGFLTIDEFLAEYDQCFMCHGTGEVPNPIPDCDPDDPWIPCHRCDGYGFL